MYHKWRLYDVWCLSYKPRQTRVLVILGHSLSFDPPSNLKNHSNKKIKQNTWRYYCFTLAYHKLWLYHVCFLIYGVRQTEHFIILDYLLPFYPLTIQKIKILKKCKKHLEISSLYTSVPQIMIICYTFPKVWRVTD